LWSDGSYYRRAAKELLLHKIFVGNLPYQANASQLQEWFMTNGFPAQSVSIIVDRFSGQPRGFGFVEMSEELAVRCVMACNGQDFLGRTLVINDAHASWRVSA
jgi:RNA recognition motif-containing protein